MLLRKVEYWGQAVETDVRPFGRIMCICICVSEAYVYAYTLEVGWLSLVIDDMVCYVGIAMRDRLRAFCATHENNAPVFVDSFDIEPYLMF